MWAGVYPCSETLSYLHANAINRFSSRGISALVPQIPSHYCLQVFHSHCLTHIANLANNTFIIGFRLVPSDVAVGRHSLGSLLRLYVRTVQTLVYNKFQTRWAGTISLQTDTERSNFRTRCCTSLFIRRSDPPPPPPRSMIRVQPCLLASRSHLHNYYVCYYYYYYYYYY